MLRDHDTEAHTACTANRPYRIQTCSLYDKQTNSACTSTQNPSFHDAATHKQYTQKGFHAKAIPQEARNIRDSGKARTSKDWQKSVRKTRIEEMTEASKLLNKPDLDGDRILLLVQETTVVTGIYRVQQKTSTVFDKGLSCSMVTEAPLKRLNLKSLKKH